jgi:hypothetical protein
MENEHHETPFGPIIGTVQIDKMPIESIADDDTLELAISFDEVVVSHSPEDVSNKHK